MNIEHRIREIVCQQLDADLEQVKMGTLFVDDLGTDSLKAMELALALEEEFEIDILDEDTEKLRTFRDLVEYIAARIPV